ncbi:uncharacterized protein LOC103701224 isoform X2 [Phoenix dactylifera]|uniref:Uncharacterized protein LOC103701224 isoform X2 n=1 Tax=Phoenix dactylifera TaxID=42345 RepID=A0A8B9AKP1_PHODC|nr:uncharacterized protein LOC103701224 isoform X2 [Phoenix dactylifera]
MPTGDEIRVDIHRMGGQASSPGGGGMSVSVFEWIGDAAKGVGSACFHALTGPAAGPLICIFAGICAALAYRIERRATNRPVFHRSVSIAALHGGDMALERILEAQEARVDKNALNSAADEMQRLLAMDPTAISYRELHRLAAKLEMSGKEDKAIKILQQKVQEAEKNKHPHEAYELQMLLVEMLIYEAIIYSIMGDKRAGDCYEEFQEIRRCFHWCDFLEGTLLYGAVPDFNKFGKIVANLKKEIEHAKTKKP